ncbi:MAG: hypothetical protein ACN4GM_11285 [Gammaproteobacteria bacterium]
MAYKFIISGETVVASDGRHALILTESERDIVLTEMRSFLQSVQQITLGVSNQDMVIIGNAAKAVGAAAQNSVPGSLVKKLPLEFKKLGFDTHQKFDQLALDAEEFGDPEHSLRQLTELMSNCVACHELYRIDPQQAMISN